MDASGTAIAMLDCMKSGSLASKNYGTRPGKNLLWLGSGKTRAGMTNESIAQRFSRLADLLEIKGDDTYRIRSYRNAALTIEGWPTPLKEIAADEGLKGLQTIPGVGKAISSKIIELLQTGTFEAWERTA